MVVRLSSCPWRGISKLFSYVSGVLVLSVVLYRELLSIFLKAPCALALPTNNPLWKYLLLSILFSAEVSCGTGVSTIKVQRQQEIFSPTGKTPPTSGIYSWPGGATAESPQKASVRFRLWRRFHSSGSSGVQRKVPHSTSSAQSLFTPRRWHRFYSSGSRDLRCALPTQKLRSLSPENVELSKVPPFKAWGRPWSEYRFACFAHYRVF